VNPLAWITTLVALGLALVILEVFVPSGGVLGFFSVLAIVAGVTMAFVEQGPAVGMSVLAATVMAVPIVLAVAFRIFPHTPLGRRVIAAPPGRGDVVPDAGRRAALNELVGRAGRAATDLLPWGAVHVDGVAHEALSESGPIARDSRIEVVAVDAGGLVVRAAAPSVSARASPSAVPSRGLEESLEAFDYGSLARPADAGQPGSTLKFDADRSANNS